MAIACKSFNKSVDPLQIGIFSSYAYMPNFHYHLEYEIFYLDKGDGVFVIEDSVFPISEGDVIFVEPNAKHYFSKNSQNYHYYAFVFDISILGDSNDSARMNFENIKIYNKLNLPQELLEKIRQAANLEAQEFFGREMQTKSVLFEILYYVFSTNQYLKCSNTPIYCQPQLVAVQQTCDYIKAHYKEKIDYMMLIKQSNYSKSQYIKIFKKQTGMNITDYILKCRIENSCFELLKSSKSITDIAIENGFNNIQYFSKKFKEFMNCTPRQYKITASDILIPSTCQHVLPKEK